MSRDAAAVGDKVTITCNYEETTDTGTPTISWYKDGTGFTDTQKQSVSEGDNCGDTQRSRYIITSATTADSGKYKCNASYSINGQQVVVDPNSSDGKDFYVRTLETPEASYNIEFGDSLDIVCTVTGNEPDSFKWYNSDGSTLSTEKFEIEQGTYKDYQKTSTLKIASATETDHQESFKCKASWSSKYEPKQLEQTVAISVYGRYWINGGGGGGIML